MGKLCGKSVSRFSMVCKEALLALEDNDYIVNCRHWYERVRTLPDYLKTNADTVPSLQGGQQSQASERCEGLWTPVICNRPNLPTPI